MHLILIRHGQSYVNLPDWDGGFVDTRLTPLGQQQADRAASWLMKHYAPDAIYSSSMARAKETATRIAAAYAMPFQLDDRLREIGNLWPDGTIVDVNNNEPAWRDYWASEKPFAPVCDGGETWMDVLNRVGSALHSYALAHPAALDTVFVVCHGGVINAALDVALNVGAWRSTDFWVHNTSVTHLEYKPPEARQEIWRSHGVNLCYHLLEPDGTILGLEPKGRLPA